MSAEPEIVTRRFGPTPALIVSGDAPRGTVLLCHGLGASKEAGMPELTVLAKAGLRAIGLDAVGHGERRYADFDRRMFNAAGDLVREEFYQVVEQSVAEIPALVDELLGQGLCEAGRLGIAGVSMGGYILFGAVLRERRFSAAASLVGSPLWQRGAERSPHLYPERFAPVALLMQNAGQDRSVPVEQARDFYARLLPHYRTMPERLRYHELPNAEHIMSAAEWQQMTATMVDWFKRYLQG